MKPFKNPYDTEGATLGKDESRVFTEVSTADYLLIRLIRPQTGTIKNVMGLLWQQFCYELRERNITDHTACQQFEEFVSNCRIIPADEYNVLSRAAAALKIHPEPPVRNRPPGRPRRHTAKTDGVDDRGGTPSIHPDSANQPPIVANVQSVDSVQPGEEGGTTKGEGHDKNL